MREVIRTEPGQAPSNSLEQMCAKWRVWPNFIFNARFIIVNVDAPITLAILVGQLLHRGRRRAPFCRSGMIFTFCINSTRGRGGPSLRRSVPAPADRRARSDRSQSHVGLHLSDTVWTIKHTMRRTTFLTRGMCAQMTGLFHWKNFIKITSTESTVCCKTINVCWGLTRVCIQRKHVCHNTQKVCLIHPKIC